MKAHPRDSWNARRISTSVSLSQTTTHSFQRLVGNNGRFISCQVPPMAGEAPDRKGATRSPSQTSSAHLERSFSPRKGENMSNIVVMFVANDFRMLDLSKVTPFGPRLIRWKRSELLVSRRVLG